MATVTVMNYTFQIFLLLLLLLRRWLIIAAESSVNSSVPAPAPLSFKCSDDLVSFSVCLPYVAVSPNNLTDSPPAQCCDDVLTALVNGSVICLCYFVRQPNMLGFPINSTKLLSLSSVCQRKDRNSEANFTMESLCSGFDALPPLQSITGPGNSMPSYFGANSPRPSGIGSAEEPSGSPPRTEPSGSPPREEPADELPSEPADELPSEPAFPTNPAKRSLATQATHRLSNTLLTFLLAISLLDQLKAINGLA